jgi:SET domain-containing protein
VFYATRDIKKDEEILMDYDDYPTNFDEAGLADLILADQEGRGNSHGHGLYDDYPTDYIAAGLGS